MGVQCAGSPPARPRRPSSPSLVRVGAADSSARRLPPPPPPPTKGNSSGGFEGLHCRPRRASRQKRSSDARGFPAQRAWPASSPSIHPRQVRDGGMQAEGDEKQEDALFWKRLGWREALAPQDFGGGGGQQPAGINQIKVFLPPRDKRTTPIQGEMLFLGGDRQCRRVFFPRINCLFWIFEFFISCQ